MSRSTPRGLKTAHTQAAVSFKQFKKGDPLALARLQQYHPFYQGKTPAQISALQGKNRVQLSHFQYVVAREWGYEDWHQLSRAPEAELDLKAEQRLTAEEWLRVEITYTETNPDAAYDHLVEWHLENHPEVILQVEPDGPVVEAEMFDPDYERDYIVPLRLLVRGGQRALVKLLKEELGENLDDALKFLPERVEMRRRPKGSPFATYTEEYASWLATENPVDELGRPSGAMKALVMGPSPEAGLYDEEMVRALEAELGTALNEAEVEFLKSHAGAIVEQSSRGKVKIAFHRTLAELDAAWDRAKGSPAQNQSSAQPSVEQKKPLLSEGMANFFAVEIRNEDNGGVSPSTLDSAMDSFWQADEDTLRAWFAPAGMWLDVEGEELPELDVEAAEAELRSLLERFGGDTRLEDLLSGSAREGRTVTARLEKGSGAADLLDAFDRFKAATRAAAIDSFYALIREGDPEEEGFSLEFAHPVRLELPESAPGYGPDVVRVYSVEIHEEEGLLFSAFQVLDPGGQAVDGDPAALAEHELSNEDLLELLRAAEDSVKRAA